MNEQTQAAQLMDILQMHGHSFGLTQSNRLQ